MNILLTGASSGIGFEAVLELILKSENKVIALARSTDKLSRLLEIAKGVNPECILFPVLFDLLNDDFEQGL
jgi:NAD(P)-dependent dehydrogenase (short-subunit alcohol dehydrogenase family)